MKDSYEVTGSATSGVILGGDTGVTQTKWPPYPIICVYRYDMWMCFQ